MIKTLLDTMEKKPMYLLKENPEERNKDPSFILRPNSYNEISISGFKQTEIDNYIADGNNQKNKIITPPKI